MWQHSRCNPEYGTGVYLARYNRLVDPVAICLSCIYIAPFRSVICGYNNHIHHLHLGTFLCSLYNPHSPHMFFR
jgi:hypothetical protein